MSRSINAGFPRDPAGKKLYALVVARGKQFKSSLKINNLAEARRKLKDYRNDMGRIDPNPAGHQSDFTGRNLIE